MQSFIAVSLCIALALPVLSVNATGLELLNHRNKAIANRVARQAHALAAGEAAHAIDKDATGSAQPGGLPSHLPSELSVAAGHELTGTATTATTALHSVNAIAKEAAEQPEPAFLSEAGFLSAVEGPLPNKCSIKTDEEGDLVRQGRCLGPEFYEGKGYKCSQEPSKQDEHQIYMAEGGYFCDPKAEECRIEWKDKKKSYKVSGCPKKDRVCVFDVNGKLHHGHCYFQWGCGTFHKIHNTDTGNYCL
ncbi:unnamed protein product [Vitrella brassicaformis CCMP3155]|uniref:Uncharacterized protein n=1 Tax=Vitrella brassicaformis (strain CCMP3155) TaxID=1169540 RepID=A0A0G4G6C8_VITBC|nr:unnamed protein product [Vitrella brassicaformis CCMP3155]|eukprot:CEM23813.1 unnamed protein product [Vitrella brassicaformis CCMP3155]